MTDIERQREWLALLEAEHARRAARVAWQASEDERQKEQLVDMLWQMTERFAALAHLHPLEIDDMAPAEMLACHLLPEEMRPAGLPTEAAIWADIEKAKRETWGR